LACFSLQTSFRSALLSVLTLSALLIAILIEHTRSDPFHPSPQIKDDHDDIDPTGRGSPGIVIVYKKTGEFLSNPQPSRRPLLVLTNYMYLYFLLKQ